MEFVFDNKIKPKEENFSSLKDLEKNLLKKTKDINKSDKYYDDIYSGLNDILETNSGFPDEIIEKYRIGWNSTYSNYHQGYLWYLYSAFMSDSGIEIAPWYLYNVILHQISQVIKDNVEEYTNIFTFNQEKNTIKMFSNEFDINLYSNIIKQLIPDSNTYNTFFPTWSNSPLHYNECIQGLFSDMVQKYYEAMILGCSCPKVRVLGTQEDWDKLLDTIIRLKEIFNSNNAQSLDNYLLKVITCLTDFKSNWNKHKTWEKFFFVSNCGSGSQESIGGTIRELLNYSSKQEMLVHQLPNTISRFPFIALALALDIEKEEEESYFISGIIGSKLDIDGFLVPSYDYCITWIDKAQTQLNETMREELKWIKEQLYRWESISISGTFIKHHFNHNCSQYLTQINNNIYLNEEEEKIIDIDIDCNSINKYITKLFNSKLEEYLRLKEKLFFNIGEEPSFFSVKQEFYKRKQNGTKEQYIKKIEKERLEKLTNVNISYSHLWFEGITHIEPSKFYWKSNKNAQLDLSQYLKCVEKVNEYSSQLLNPEYMEKFINRIKYLNKMLKTDYNPSDIIYGTLNPQIIKLYGELFPTECEYVLNMLLKKFNKFNKNKDNGVFISYIVHEVKHFMLQDDLIQYLMKIFSVQLNELLNKQIDLIIKKLENQLQERNQFEKETNINCTEGSKYLNNSLLNIFELKKLINSKCK